mgnify:CR=1 FL=1
MASMLVLFTRIVTSHGGRSLISFWACGRLPQEVIHLFFARSVYLFRHSLALLTFRLTIKLYSSLSQKHIYQKALRLPGVHFLLRSGA